MATYSSLLAWRIPWTEEPGELQSMGSERVRHDWATNSYYDPAIPLLDMYTACVCVCSALSYSLWPYGLEPTRILCPWDCPGKNIGMGCHFLFQEIFLTQGLNLCFLSLLHCKWILYQSHRGSPWENHNSKRHMYPSAHCNTIYNSQDWKQPKCPLTDEWIKKMICGFLKWKRSLLNLL